MIKYQLKCDAGHEFEGWFRDSADYDNQAQRHLVECPVCGSSNVRKALMAPAVARSGALKKGSDTEARRAKVAQDLAQAAQKARDYVEKNFDYVGGRFPEEARRIHYGETEDRNIYGEATGGEVKELLDEGVSVAPVPEAQSASPTPRKKLN